MVQLSAAMSGTHGQAVVLVVHAVGDVPEHHGDGQLVRAAEAVELPVAVTVAVDPGLQRIGEADAGRIGVQIEALAPHHRREEGGPAVRQRQPWVVVTARGVAQTGRTALPELVFDCVSILVEDDRIVELVAVCVGPVDQEGAPGAAEARVPDALPGLPVDLEDVRRVVVVGVQHPFRIVAHVLVGEAEGGVEVGAAGAGCQEDEDQGEELRSDRGERRYGGSRWGARHVTPPCSRAPGARCRRPSARRRSGADRARRDRGRAGRRSRHGGRRHLPARR